MELLQQVAQASNKSLKELIKVWRQPTFSIANIVSSGATNKTVIPRKVTADISMRLVPDQVGCDPSNYSKTEETTHLPHHPGSQDNR